MQALYLFSPLHATITTILLLFIAITTALERAFISYSKIRFEVDKKQEKRYALLLEEALEREWEYLHSFKVANNLFLIFFTLSLSLISPTIWIALLVTALSVIILAKLLPLVVATINPTPILRYFISLAKIYHLLFSPFLEKERVAPSQWVEKEESSDIVLLQNALNFSDVKVRECMIPRTEVSALSIDESPEELLNQFIESGYSRVVVYQETIDNVVGYIHSKDLFAGAKPITEIIREIEFVQEEMEAQDLLTSMIKGKVSIAVVKDEYGGTAGIVTLEDLIEEIFGEISDELDREELAERALSNNRFIFSGRLEIKYLNKNYPLELPESDDYETLGGFITWFNQNIPTEGELLSYGNWHFSILKIESNRVESVLLTIVEE